MKNYGNITYWENSRRTRVLWTFRDLAITYFNNIQYQRQFDSQEAITIENDEARIVRQKINLMSREVLEVVLATGIRPTAQVTPPPLLGGRTHEISFFDDVFNLSRFGITPQNFIDMLERALGVYQYDRRKSLWRICNPLWWVGQVLQSLAQLPFMLIGAAGFNAGRAEESILGRLLKFFVMALTVVASSLAILEFVGWLDTIKLTLGIVDQ